MGDPLSTYELDGAIALIGLNRPDKRNAINDSLIDELEKQLKQQLTATRLFAVQWEVI